MNSDAPLYLILDLETTGLEPTTDMILEVAYAVTEDLTKADEAHIFSHLTWADVATAAQMAVPFVRGMHTTNGLWAALEDPDTDKLVLEDIEDAILRVIQGVGQSFERPVHLVGNSIGSLDLPFIKAKMPLLAQRLHYRVLDLTSVNLLIQGIGGPDTKVVAESTHRAADDVRLTIQQMANQAAILRSGI